MAAIASSFWSPSTLGTVTICGVIVHKKEAEPAWPAWSVAVAVTV
jgi:hypothetical protein